MNVRLQVLLVLIACLNIRCTAYQAYPGDRRPRQGGHGKRGDGGKQDTTHNPSQFHRRYPFPASFRIDADPSIFSAPMSKPQSGS